MKIQVTAPAQRQADQMDRWWRAHRDAAGLFAQEFAAALSRILADPEHGGIYVERGGVIVRRVRMPKTRNHVYYELDAAAGVVKILAVWGAPKRRGPKL